MGDISFCKNMNCFSHYLFLALQFFWWTFFFKKLGLTVVNMFSENFHRIFCFMKAKVIISFLFYFLFLSFYLIPSLVLQEVIISFFILFYFSFFLFNTFNGSSRSSFTSAPWARQASAFFINKIIMIKGSVPKKWKGGKGLQRRISAFHRY